MSTNSPPHRNGPGYQAAPGSTMLPSGAPNPYGALPAPIQPNVSAIVLTSISAVLTFSVYCACLGIPPLIFGILGIAKQSTDPEGANRLTKIGWVVLGGLTALAIIAVVAVIVLLAVNDTGSPSGSY